MPTESAAAISPKPARGLTREVQHPLMRDGTPSEGI